MRNDYFTLCELAYVVRNDMARLKRIFETYEDFPVVRVGVRYVIPKDRFFEWFDKHKTDEGLLYRFDNQSIEDARTEYVRKRLENRIRRLPRRADQLKQRGEGL